MEVFIGATSRYKNELPFGLAQFTMELLQRNVRVSSVQTKGKFMYWTFTNDYYMLCTFGMSGQWFSEEKKHTCLEFHFGEEPLGSFERLYFVDPRHFGTIKFTRNKQILLDKLDSLGWAPLQDKLDDYHDHIALALQKSLKPIAQLLMDQSIFAGVGNYVKCEALYRSKISPWRIGKSLSIDDVFFLCRAIDNVMHESYNAQGATISTYKTTTGENGNFSNFFKVYGRKLDLLNNKVIKEVTPDKRSTYWCPSIQK
jgi:formamidopyrimidine-DNA glycosylase